MDRNRIIRLVVSVLVGVIAAAAIAYMQIDKSGDIVISDNGYLGKAFGGDFAGLMDQDGKILERDAFHDKYQLVFFGFTHCPAICPNELQKFAYLLKNLDENQREKLAPIFITVDPARDTPDVMKSYVSAFGSGITGVTGRQERINEVLGEWKVYASKTPLGDGDYTMDHSAFVYLRDPDGRLVAIFGVDETPEALLASVKDKIGG